MSKRVYIDTENNVKYMLELKTDMPEVYQERQQELKECYDTGKCFSLQKVYCKTCPVCNDTFYTTTSGQIYDTDKCKGKARWKRQKEIAVKICPACNGAFTPARYDAIYCSDKCRQHTYRYRKTTQQY